MEEVGEAYQRVETGIMCKPRYALSDVLRGSYWWNMGKEEVGKERFLRWTGTRTEIAYMS